MDQSQRLHDATRYALENAVGLLLVSPFVLAELDHLVLTRIGGSAEASLLEEFGRGVYLLEPFTLRDVSRAATVIRQYPDLGLGLADASNVVLAERHGTREILTLDERHFRAVSGPRGEAFRIIPADL